MTDSGRRHLWTAAGLCLLGLIAFHNSFDVPFFPDDEISIVDNPRVRQLSPLGLPDYVESPISGRPFVRLSLAINYALGELKADDAPLARVLGVGGGGSRPRGYHVVNLGLHIASAWLLYSLCLLTLRQPRPDLARWRSSAVLLSAMIAAIWVVHPLQVDAVTYVSQRTELMVGFFYLLLMVLSVVAHQAGRHSAAWLVAAVIACAGGMLSKEVMASAPIMVVLYDRVFLFDDWQQAWRRRRWFYTGLASTWGILLNLVLAGPRDETVGFGLGVQWWQYAATQFGVVTNYLRLSVWPTDLNIDYGRTLTGDAVSILLPGAFIGLLVAASVRSLRRWAPAGLLGAWFFLILAPSSSIVPIVTEIAAERRMHLPLAAVIVLFVLGLHAALSRVDRDSDAAGRRRDQMLVGVTVVVVTALCVLTVQRNDVLGDDLMLWSDTVAKTPDSCSARNNLGRAYYRRGQIPAALTSFSQALRLEHCERIVHSNYAKALIETGRGAEAIVHLQGIVQRYPDFLKGYEAIGLAHLRQERWDQAEPLFRKCIERGYRTADLYVNLGMVRYQQGDAGEAKQLMMLALEKDPSHVTARDNLIFLSQ